MTDPRRSLPQIDAVVRASGASPALRRVATWIASRELDAMRASLEAGRLSTDPAAEVEARVRVALDGFERARPRRVINATGVLLHTNLGRAPLADAAIEAAIAVAGSSALELSLDDGARGGRGASCELLVTMLTQGEDALIVNNNAGALVLVLAALAKRREVIVSRGELVEIGGAFRLPAVMEAAGVSLREVGTTNRTRLSDIRDAIGPRTGAVLRVHPSNFTITGFTEAPARSEVIELCRAHDIPYLEDLGSGLLEPDPSLPGEPDATTALRDGADVVCFSGDKLLGGPQAGILVGRAELIQACRAHPLARALRADKLSLGALDATLRLHAAGEAGSIPVVAMRSVSLDALRERGRRITDALDGRAELIEVEATIGGGSAPGRTVASTGIALAGDARANAATLRSADPPIIARIHDDRCTLDLRSIDPRDDDTVRDILVSMR